MLSQHAFEHWRSSFFIERRIFFILAFGIPATTISWWLSLGAFGDILNCLSDIASPSDTVVISRLKKVTVC